LPLTSGNVCACGCANNLAGSYNAILGGYQNIINHAGGGTSYSSILGGTLNIICNYATANYIIENGVIGGGNGNQIVACSAQQSVFAFIGGGLQNCIYTHSGGKSATHRGAVIIGGYQNKLLRPVNHNVIFGGRNNCNTGSVSYTNIFGGCLLTATASSYSYGNYLYKTSGKFSIRHPDPAKMHTHNLQHSFVEAPTEGENLYRFEVATQGCQATVSLPSYYKFLNCNDQVWITPKEHTGVAYGTVNEEQTEINIKSNCDASYYVLLIGTRKDINRFRGVEQDTIVCRVSN